MDKSDAKPLRVGIYAVPGFALMSYASTVEPMRAVNRLSGQTLFELTNFNTGDAPVVSSGPALVMPQAQIGEMPQLDYLFVVAGGDPMPYRDSRVFAWLQRMDRAGVTLGGVSGGPVILARAGLMTGRRMTVHWEHAEALAEEDPDLLIERTLYVIDRDRVTCAGGTAALDMLHALIARHHGAPFARLVSDWFMHTEVRPAFGPQRSGLGDRIGTTNKTVLDAVSAMEDTMADPLNLSALARIAGVSPRQLNRLFASNLGVPVMQFYADLRLEKARTLLRGSALTVTEISIATGFASPAHFSRRFTEAYGQPPSKYRAS